MSEQDFNLPRIPAPDLALLQAIDESWVPGANPDLFWLGAILPAAGDRPAGFAMVPFTSDLLPLTDSSGALRTLTKSVGDALGLEHGLTLKDVDGRSIERLTVGHFTPTTTPDGHVVQFAQFAIAKPPTL